MQHFMQRLNLVYSLSDEDALAVKILIDVGGGMRIDVEAGLS